LLSGSPYSWETVLSSTTVVNSVILHARAFVDNNDSPEHYRRRSHVGEISDLNSLYSTSQPGLFLH